MSTTRSILELLYLMTPVYAANMAAPFSRFWPWRNPPIDARRLGTHKTWVGVGLAIAAAVGTAFALSRIGWLPVPEADRWLGFGATLGAAAMAGDALKSGIKRRIGIPPGARWFPADQLDFLIAGALALRAWWPYEALPLAAVLAVSVAADLIVNRVAYRLGIRTSPW